MPIPAQAQALAHREILRSSWAPALLSRPERIAHGRQPLSRTQSDARRRGPHSSAARCGGRCRTCRGTCPKSHVIAERHVPCSSRIHARAMAPRSGVHRGECGLLRISRRPLFGFVARCGNGGARLRGAVPNGFGVWRPVTRSGHRHRRSDAPLRLSPELDGHSGVWRRWLRRAAGLRTQRHRLRSVDVVERDPDAAGLDSTGSRTPRSSARGDTRTSSSRGTTTSTFRWASTRRSLGLGQSPDDVTITGAVRAKADWLGNNNATCNFWRGAENLAVIPTSSIDSSVDVWAVSQGTHLRRVHVQGDVASRRQRRLVERRVHRRLGHRREARLGIAAAVPHAQRRSELERLELEHGVRRRRDGTERNVAQPSLHGRPRPRRSSARSRFSTSMRPATTSSWCPR